MDTAFLSLKEWVMGAAAALLPEVAVPYVGLALNMAAILVVAPLTMMYLTLIERKVIARMQDRYGPNRVGKFGLLQPIADGVKMIQKEVIVPAGADKPLHFIAPIVSVAIVLMMFTVMPFGRGMAALDVNIAILFFMAVSALEIVPVFVAGWASRNKFALLGSMRAVAQMVSYEVPLGLALLAVVMATGSASLMNIVEAQQGVLSWNVWTPWGLLGFVLFFITGTAEVNRTPFDLAEGESELVAGYHTEYTGMKFAMFQMAEFLSAFAVCGLTVTLFFGGWQGPLLPSWMWFFGKSLFFFAVMVWVRGTLPRIRVDQLMGFGWKFLVPMGLVNLGVVAVWLYGEGRGAAWAAARWPLCAAIALAGWMFFSRLQGRSLRRGPLPIEGAAPLSSY